MSLDAWTQRENLPCCTFVAAWVLERRGHRIGSVSEGIAAGGRDWWEAANVWDRDEPWSALDAADAKLRGGSQSYVPLVDRGHPAPPLTPGRWHVVQRWRGLDMGGAGLDDDRVANGATGHTYLAHLDHHGRCRILQSSTSRGYRDTTGTWSGTAGLDGYAVAVLTLPPHVQE